MPREAILESHPGNVTSTIVVGVDGSPDSEHALQWALRLSEATGQPVRAVMVVTPPAFPGGGFDGFAFAGEPDPFDATMLLERSLERAIADAKRRERIGRRVLIGSVTERLLEESESAAVLVVGQGRNPIGRRFFGIARVLVSRARCPVLVVPNSADAPAVSSTAPTASRVAEQRPVRADAALSGSSR